MRIHVNLEGTRYPVDVNRQATFYDVRSLLQEKSGVPAHKLRIMLTTQPLSRDATEREAENQETLVHAGIRQGMVLSAFVEASRMKLTIQTCGCLGHEKYPLFVHASDTIADIKTHIRQAKGVPTHLQKLLVTKPSYNEFTDKSQSLADYRIDDLSTIYLLLDRVSIPSTAFNIQVQTGGKSGKSISLDVASDTKVAAVKTLIQDRKGIPVDQQRLIFAGQQLHDCLYLAECGVAPGSSLQLVLKLRGC